MAGGCPRTALPLTGTDPLNVGDRLHQLLGRFLHAERRQVQVVCQKQRTSLRCAEYSPHLHQVHHGERVLARDATFRTAACLSLRR